MTTPEQAVKPMSLLQLPAEIRNLIYDFTLTPGCIVLAPPSYQIEGFCHATRRDFNWSGLRRKALGLTQTCRQLRAEFLPLHQQAVEVIICSGRVVEQYLRDFFLVPPQANGILTVRTRFEETSFNLAPLMRASRATPWLKFDIYHFRTSMSLEYAQNVLIDVVNNKKWGAYFDEAVERIIYAVNSVNSLVRPFNIQIRAASAEDWMFGKLRGNAVPWDNSKKPEVTRTYCLVNDPTYDSDNFSRVARSVSGSSFDPLPWQTIGPGLYRYEYVNECARAAAKRSWSQRVVKQRAVEQWVDRVGLKHPKLSIDQIEVTVALPHKSSIKEAEKVPKQMVS